MTSTITLKEFCKSVSVSYQTGLRWFHAGKIPGAFRFTRQIIIPRSTLDAIECGGMITPESIGNKGEK